MNTETIDKLYKEHIAHDELPKEFQIGMECFLDALKAQSAATPPDVEQASKPSVEWETFVAYVKNAFYKGFEKATQDDASSYQAWREEAATLLPTTHLKAGQSAVQDATPCDAMGHYGGRPLREGKCPKCGKNWDLSQDATPQEGLYFVPVSGVEMPEKEGWYHVSYLLDGPETHKHYVLYFNGSEWLNYHQLDFSHWFKMCQLGQSETGKPVSLKHYARLCAIVEKKNKELSTLRSELSAAQEENKRLRALGNSAITPPIEPVQEEESPWISVEDRLPEINAQDNLALEMGESKPCLVWVNRFGVRFATHYDKGGFKAWSVGGITGLDNKDITHWMPLPKPPISRLKSEIEELKRKA